MLKQVPVNAEFEIDCLIEKGEVSHTKNGKPYVSFKFRDQSGSVDAKWWDYDATFAGLITAGTVVRVAGIMGEFNGSPQVKVLSIEPSLLTPDDFMRRSRYDVEEMWKTVTDTIESITEPLTHFVAKEIFDNSPTAKMFKRSPAATGVHNNWLGGLLEHVVSMLHMAEAAYAHYSKIYPKLSRDKLLFGVIFHDLGKIMEYDQTNPAFDKAELGYLVNHIVMGPAWVFHICSKATKDFVDQMGGATTFKKERAHLMHLIASHHGRLDWGSPVPPATLEAVLLHHIDNMDSKFMHALDLVESALEKDDETTSSEYSRFERVKYIFER